MVVRSRSREVEYDRGRHPRAKLGFVLLATEQTIPDDMYRMCPPGIGLHFARVNNADDITSDNLAAIAPDLTRCARTLLPDGSIDVVSYACTSGSLVLGQEEVESRLRSGAPDARPSSIIAAVIRALHALKVSKIVVVTPYLDEINEAEKIYLEDRGFSVLAIEGLNIKKDSDMVRVTPDFIRRFAASVDLPDAEAIFISCGALRSIDIVDSLERQVGKPVVTSNQAMLWDALRLAGISDTVAGFGKLLADADLIYPGE